MIKNVALFFSVTDEKTPYKQLLQYETVRNNEVCVLSRCPYSEVFQQVQSSQKKKKTKEWLEFSWGLYCLVVLFLVVYVICASIPTEGTVKQGLTVLQKLKIKTWVKSTHDTTLSVFCLIPSRCQISKITYSHVQDSQVTTLWSFLVVRNCFENLSWYFLVKEETLAPITSQPPMFKLL